MIGHRPSHATTLEPMMRYRIPSPSRHSLLIVLFAAHFGLPSLGLAQDAPSPPPVPPFLVQSPDGQNTLQIDVLAHIDGRFAVSDEPTGTTDAFTVRRLRPILQGRLLGRFEFFFNPDFGGGTAVVQDAYFDTVFSTAFRVRLGKSKTPVGLERMILANSLVFVERAFPTTLTPNRDIGVQVLGDIAGTTLSYHASVQNGATDGASVDSDSNDNKEMALRLTFRPFSGRSASRLRGLGLAFGASTGTIAELPVLRTTTLFQPFLSYAGATADGRRSRTSPQAFLYRGPFSTFAEYVESSQPIRRGAANADISHRAWQIAASYVLTGEIVTERGVRPRNNFDFGGGHVGAIQVAARYHALSVDDEAIELGLATPGSSSSAEAFTVGVNWYLNPFIKYVLNFERTTFDDRPRPAENAIVLRGQLFF